MLKLGSDRKNEIVDTDPGVTQKTAAAPPHREEPVEVVRVSGKCASWTPPQ